MVWYFLQSVLHRLIGLVGRVFAYGPVDLGSIPSRVIPKTLKWYLIPPWLTHSNIRYASRVKWSNPGKGAVLSPTPRCSSYWKGSLLVTIDYGHQLYLTYCDKHLVPCTRRIVNWSTASESTGLRQPDLDWSSIFLQPQFLEPSYHCNVINFRTIDIRVLLRGHSPIRTRES